MKAQRAAKVLLISDRYLPEVGGSIYWFDNLYRRYPKDSVWILTQAYPGSKAFDSASGTRIHFTRVKLRRHAFLRPESLLIYVKLLFAGIWIVLRNRVSIIHASKVLPEGLVARCISRLLGVPYLVYAHGEEITIFSRNPDMLRHLRKVYDGAARVVANSSFTANCVRNLGCHGENVVRISPGVDPDAFRPGPRNGDLVREQRLEGKTVLLSVGRLQKRKGHDNVLRAMPEILASCPDLVYLVTSHGEEEEPLRRLAAKLDVEHAVRFVGETPLALLQNYYNTCDIFILANRTLEDGDVEGFGMVFLEASSCGKPVIAGDSGGTGDPVKDAWNGLRLDTTKPENIAKAVIQLASNPGLREKMGSNGRALVESDYSWDSVVRKFAATDADILAGRAAVSEAAPNPQPNSLGEPNLECHR